MVRKKQEKLLSHDPNPTPYLGRPSPDRKSFTYSENQLLDQITTEVMWAWSRDLEIMQEYYMQIKENSQSLISTSELISEKFPEIEKFISETSIFKSILDMLSAFEKVNQRQTEMNFNIKQLCVEVKTILNEKKEENKKEKSVWSRIFNRKESK